MLKLLGIDSQFKAPGMLDQPVINASDFRGEAFGILARAQQADLEAQKNRIINTSSTDININRMREASEARIGGGGFDPNLDVSEREKWEYNKNKDAEEFKYNKNKDAAEFNLNVAKFKQDSGLEERRYGLDKTKFGREVYEDERNYDRKVLESDRTYEADRSDEEFDRGMDVAKFDYQANKDTQERNDKLYEKAKTEFQQQQYALAQQNVQELVLASEGLMRKGGGLEAIRGGLQDIFQKYPGISPEKQAEIIQTVYATPQRVNRDQIVKTEQKIEEVQQFQRNTVLQAKRIELQSMTAALKTATGSRRQQLLKGLTTKLGEFSSSNADPLTKAMVLSNLYTEVATKGEVGADVQQKLLDYATYSRDASKLYLMRNKMSPAQYRLQESMLQQKYGVTGFRLDDTNFDNKVALETLTTNTNLKELRIKNAIDNKFGMNASKATIAQLAKANQTPAQIAALEATSARYGRPPALEAAIKLAKDSYAHREKTVEVQQKISTLEKEAAMIQSADAKTVLEMLEGDKQGNMSSLITTAMLSQANPKLAEALASKKPIDPQTKASIMQTWKQQRQRIINEINIQKRLVQTQHSLERDYLDSYFNKDNFSSLDALTREMPNIRNQMGGAPVGVSRGQQGGGGGFQQNGMPRMPTMPGGGARSPIASPGNDTTQATGNYLRPTGESQTVWELPNYPTPKQATRQQPENPATWAQRQQRTLGGGRR